MPVAICFWFERQVVRRAASRAWLKTGSAIAARIEMIAITTRSSMSVKPPRLRPSGGYRKLRSFQVSTIIYDTTISFCDRFLDKRSRTVDQMVQAARSGRQNIAEGSRASAASSKTELRLVNGTVYVKGTPAALDYYLLDLTTPQAKQYAGKWISFPKGDRLHASLADRLMLASVVKHALPRNHFTSGGKLKLLRRTSHGTPLFVLRWTEDDLFDHVIRARATGTPLPVSFYDSCGFECDSRDTFSKWNEPVKVQAPASSTPIAVVRG